MDGHQLLFLGAWVGESAIGFLQHVYGKDNSRTNHRSVEPWN